MKRSLLLRSLIVIASLYFALPAAALRWWPDALIFASATQDATHESRRFEIDAGAGDSVLIRRYGDDQPICVYFFPGQHGAMGTYEKTLFPILRGAGVTIYAISYPGQDGASGRSRLATLPEQIDRAIAAVAASTSCKPGDSVFVGRSLGATLALTLAVRFKPRGVIVDGVGVNLTSAVRAWIDRHPLCSGWRWLPIERLLGEHSYSLNPVLDELRSTPVTVFQGTDDAVTPFAPARDLFAARSNVVFNAVANGAHDNSYLIARGDYLKTLRTMLALDPGGRSSP